MPFKQKADTTNVTFQMRHIWLFLPFKQKADATNSSNIINIRKLFLPFKQKADATDIREALEANVVFTFQTEGRCNWQILQ